MVDGSSLGLMALWAEMCGVLFGLLTSGDECRFCKSMATGSLLDLKRREMLEVWDSRTASQYQQVHSE